MTEKIYICYLPESIILYKKDLYLFLKYKSFTFLITVPTNVSIIRIKNALILKYKKKISSEVITSIINFKNLISGIYRPHYRRLLLKGIGYRVSSNEINTNILNFKLGFSHLVQKNIPTNVVASIRKSNILDLKSIFKNEVSQFAYNLYFTKKPDIYKGKGFNFKGQKINLKIGKKSA